MDPDKLRGVFEALLANQSSRQLMRRLLKGAGMPFNEAAFEEQVKVRGADAPRAACWLAGWLAGWLDGWMDG